MKRFKSFRLHKGKGDFYKSGNQVKLKAQLLVVLSFIYTRVTRAGKIRSVRPMLERVYVRE